MDMVKSTFDRCFEVETGIKADGTLTLLCRHCCLNNLKHNYEVYGDCTNYDVVSFHYQDEKDPEVMHPLHWLEEKSAKYE